MRMARALTLLVVALSPSWTLVTVDTAEKSITLPPDNPMGELKPGPGVEVARRNCIACHSTDYIVLQPPSDAKRWAAEVNKMTTVFGAPISEADAKVIVEYLATAYGPESESPRTAGPR